MKDHPVPPYAEPVAATNFSFLRGASPAADLVLTSLLLGHTGLGIADRNTLAGVVRAWSALRELRAGGILPAVKQRQGAGPGEYHYISSALDDDTPAMEALRAQVRQRAQRFKLATGVRLAFGDGTPDIVAYAQNRTGWARLCRLLTTGNRRAAKGDFHLSRRSSVACRRSAGDRHARAQSGASPRLAGAAGRCLPRRALAWCHHAPARR